VPVSTGTRPGLRTSPRRGDRHATHRGQRHDDARRATRRVQPPSVPEVRGPCQWPPLAQRRVESGADRDGQTTMISVLGVPLKGRRETHVRVGHAVTVGTHSRRRRTATRLRPTDATDRGGSRSTPFSIVCSASRRQRRGLETHKGEEAISTATVTERAADELGLVAFLREREERLRVRRGRPPLRHRLGPRSSPARCCLVTSARAKAPHRAPWMGPPSRLPRCP